MEKLKTLLQPTPEFNDRIDVLTMTVFRCRQCGQLWRQWIASHYIGETTHLEKFDPSGLPKAETPWDKVSSSWALVTPFGAIAGIGLLVGLVMGLLTMPTLETGAGARRDWVFRWMYSGMLVPLLAAGIIWLVARLIRLIPSARPHK